MHVCIHANPQQYNGGRNNYMFFWRSFAFFSPFLHLNPSCAIASCTAEATLSPRVLHPTESYTDSQGLSVAQVFIKYQKQQQIKNKPYYCQYFSPKINWSCPVLRTKWRAPAKIMLLKDCKSHSHNSRQVSYSFHHAADSRSHKTILLKSTFMQHKGIKWHTNPLFCRLWWYHCSG